MEKRRIVYYLDNASIHCQYDVIKYFMDEKMEVVYGIPYTPELNAAEFVFAEMKNLFYRRVFRTK